MKKFIMSLVTNRLGIILATLNLCFFASKSNAVQALDRIPLGRFFLVLNLPSLICAGFSSEIVISIYTGLTDSSQKKIGIFFATFFMILQWLFIGWLAKSIAGKLTRAK